MWQGHPEKRLVAWADLRNSCKENPNLGQVITSHTRLVATSTNGVKIFTL